ncbi:MAG: hypothetical protein H6R22_1572, partial [Chromatiaceae bacterium]|nr:hypothetical protein [Chromatiaceae bacterium]
MPGAGAAGAGRIGAGRVHGRRPVVVRWLGGGVPHSRAQQVGEAARLGLVECQFVKAENERNIHARPAEKLLGTRRGEDLTHGFQDDALEAFGVRGLVVKHGELLVTGGRT